MTDNRHITTEQYRLTPATYFRIAAGARLPTLLATALLVALTSTMAAILFDLRILLVALIALFLIFPFVVAHIYYSKLLTTDAQYALMPKKVEIIPGITISEIYSPTDVADDTDALQKSDEAPSAESGKYPDPGQPETGSRPVPDRHFEWKELRSARTTSKELILTLTDDGYNLIIPLKTISEIDIKKIFHIGEVVKNY